MLRNQISAGSSKYRVYGNFEDSISQKSTSVQPSEDIETCKPCLQTGGDMT